MPKGKTKPKTVRPMPVKWLKVIDLMAIGGMIFQDAMRETGYSEKYLTTKGHMIKQDVRFGKALEHKLATIRARTDDRREKRLQTLDDIIEHTDTTDRDVISAVQVQGRICGWLSETIPHETTERQQLLDEANRTEAARLAVLALDTRALPDGLMSSRVALSAFTKSVASQIVASGTPDSDTKAESARAVR